MNYGERFKKERKLKKVSLRKLSDELREKGIIISPSLISKFESGRSSISLVAAENLFAHFKITLVPIPDEYLKG
jgi:transcriptional regulator with XRE-family HTH domain